MAPAPDLTAIVSGQTTEGQHLDFKREIDLDDPNKRSDIIDDVVAFLNADGGQVLIGIQENKKMRNATLIPLVGDDDAFCRRLQDILVTNIASTPSELKVYPISIEGGFIAVIDVERNKNKPYCNKLKGKYLRRCGAKNEPLLPGEVNALRSERSRLVQTVSDRARAYLYDLEQENYFKYPCPRLQLAILPLEHFDDSFPTFEYQQKTLLKPVKRLVAPGLSREECFKREANGYSVMGLNGTDEIAGRFFVGDDWFMHLILCHPIPFVNSEGTINWGQVRPDMKGDFDTIHSFLDNEGLHGPFGVSGEIVHVHSREHFERYFPRTKTISFGRPTFIETFDPKALLDLIYDKIYQSSIHG